MADTPTSANNFTTSGPGSTRPGGTSGPDAGRPGSQNRDIGEQAQQTLGHVTERAGNFLTSQADRQMERAAGGLDSVAGALEQAARQLGNQQMGLDQYVDSAASQVRALSGYLRSNDVGEVIDDVEDVARRQPALFIGGAFVLGFLGARFLASSRPAPSRVRRTTSPGIGGSPRLPAMG
jgi:hypothetical protein